MAAHVSVIVPLFNSVDLVPACQAALRGVLDGISNSEIIYVDDGSSDHTLDLLRQIQNRDGDVRIVELAGNYGQHAALLAGIERARGEHIVTIDVDLQCDPRDIPRLLAPLSEGYDLVCGVRVGRADPLARRLFSQAMSSLVRRLSRVSLRDAGCSFTALTQELGLLICRGGEFRRFGKPLAARLARSVAEVEVHQAPLMQKRKSSYSGSALVRLFMDFFVSALGDIFGWIFLIASASSFVFGIATLAGLFAWIVASFSSLMPVISGALCAFSGLMAMLALAADYMQRIYRQTSGAPMYIVRKVHEASRDSS
jgi:undecaprenyl-phosphate 4-deoxy-4-formamido-L-arabinose transferase